MIITLLDVDVVVNVIEVTDNCRVVSEFSDVEYASDPENKCDSFRVPDGLTVGPPGGSIGEKLDGDSYVKGN